ncbi:hypothetical protein ACLB0R_13680 [Sphingomonas sp. GlSt437]
MTAVAPDTPVLVGVGQLTRHWRGAQDGAAPDPAGLRAAASRIALDDSGAGAALARLIDRVVVIRTMADSVPGVPQPFGRCANPPATLAADLGLGAVKAIYSVVGGDQPQALVNEAAALIHAGAARAVLIAGAEATAAFKVAQRSGLALDWSRSADRDVEDRGYGARLLSRYEVTNGLGAPVLTYPAFEHALRARRGLSRDDHARLMAALWEGFAAIAAANPLSQFPQARDAAFLMTPSAENYPVADPYLKWHVAQDAVNQGAAVILTSSGEADRLGVAPARRIYLHGHAHVADRVPTERPDLSRSRAMALALDRALDASAVTADALGPIDLYSCFPCAVLIAAEALGLDWRQRALTVTGGLPFFGGPGNSYSLHAIASMVDRLRAAPGDYGLVLANGGFLSKQAVGIYAAQPPIDWRPVDSSDLGSAINADPMPAIADGPATIRVETYTVGFAKGAPARGYCIGRTAEGARVLARTRQEDGAMLQTLLDRDPIGATAQIARDGEANLIAALESAA